jgi:hypothetical protein
MIRQLGKFLTTAPNKTNYELQADDNRQLQFVGLSFGSVRHLRAQITVTASVCRSFVWLSSTFESTNHRYNVELAPTSVEIMPRSKFDLSPVTEETAIPSNVGLNQTKEEMTHRANV